MSFGFSRSAGRHGRRPGAALASLAIGVLIASQAGVSTVTAPESRTLEAATDGASAAVVAAIADATPDAVTAAAEAAVLDAGLEPSIQYEETVAHDHDRIAFAPGARVGVGFTPRSSDRWTVGGGNPVALPGGRLDGRTMRTQGVPPATDAAGGFSPRWPHRPVRRVAAGTDGLPADGAVTAATVDLPSGNEPSVAATNATWQVPTTTEETRPEAVVSAAGLRREIFGFLPYWQINSTTLRLDYGKISTIAYFGVGADKAGNLVKRNPDGTATVGWSGWTSSRLTGIMATAHSNHTRVVLTVQSFGWNASGLARQAALLGSSTSRLNLARQIAAAVRDRGADGVNLDFEPLAAGYDTQFTALVRTIRAELNKVHRGYQLTFDTTGSIGNYPIENATAPGGADAIFIMGYDYRSSSSSPVGSIAPLDRPGHGIHDTVVAYASRVPPSKLILGVPYYGRAWSTNGNTLDAGNTSGTKNGASTAVSYDTAASYLSQYGRNYDPAEQVAWTAYQRQNCTATYGCVTSWRELYVDDAAALGAKYDLVNTYGLRGAGIWALGYDGTRPELWSAIQRKFITDTTPPTVGVQTLAGRQVNPQFTVGWTGVDDVAVASYDVQVAIDGGAWVNWLLGTTSSSGVFGGDDGHTYAFRARGRDPNGNVSAWNVTTTSGVPSALGVGSFGRVRIDGLSVRSAGDTSATKVGTVSSGDIVAIVGGPKSADGYTWYQVTGPLSAWGPVTPKFGGRWIAARSSGQTNVIATKPPNSTRVSAMLGGLGFGGGGAASLGGAAAAVADRSFSPNGDGSGDGLRIDWTNGVALDSLALRVFRADGTLVGDVPVSQLGAGDRRVSWNGTVGGTRLADGRYLVSLVGAAGSATYVNPVSAFRSTALSTYGVTIDTMAPAVRSASIGGSWLSPNGDGRLDTIRVAIASSGATGWAFAVGPVSGSTVGAPIASRSGTGASIAVAWDGRTTSGAVAPDGTYRLTLTVSDAAGNRTSRGWNVRLDATPPAIGVSAPATFSPNRDGSADTARLAWTSSERISGTARVYHGTTLIRSWTISGATSGAVAWNGTNSAGVPVADGSYAFRVAGRDAAGNLATAAAKVVVDRTLSTLRWSVARFYPQDGDSLARTSKSSFTLARAAKVSAAIYSGTTLVRAIWTDRSLTAGAHGWTWDGRDATGAFVARGTYALRVTAVSSVGTSVLSRSILADAFATTLSSISLAPGQTLTVTFATVESLRASPTASFTQPGRAAVHKTAVSLGSGRYRLTFAIGSGVAGPATLVIAGRDILGGLNTTTRSLLIR